MIEFLTGLGDRIVHGGFKIHLAVYLVSSGIGILIIQLLFTRLLKTIAARTNISYSLLRQTFGGIPH